jgi:hypothetical protein
MKRKITSLELNMRRKARRESINNDIKQGFKPFPTSRRYVYIPVVIATWGFTRNNEEGC